MTTLAEHFFRQESGRLVAVLVRRFGHRHLEAAEDAVQHALAAAAEAWPRSGTPENPCAWLYGVARNHLVDALRRDARLGAMDARDLTPHTASSDDTPALLRDEVRDDVLRMLFVCCDDALPVESQCVLALKVLCGFDVREIAERLFMSEANVYKRLGRARGLLREAGFVVPELTAAQTASRLPTVQRVLYVLFTEGHLSSHAEGPLRRDLCDEAVRLAHELVAHPVGATPQTCALVALMHLHRARMPARQDGSGGLLLLEEQDRSQWDQAEIAAGLAWLARSAGGDDFSRFHAEAGVAAEHCLAPSFAQTRWDRVVACYALLERLSPSALHTLNRAVALAEWQGPRAGLALLDGRAPPSWLAGSYLWSAVLADLHGRVGNGELAGQHRDAALATAPSDAVRAALERRLRRT